MSWNSSADAAGKSNDTGWQFELEIPLDELNIGNKKTSINIVRTDFENKTQSEYALTFGISGLDHFIPMYQTNGYNVDLFVDLILK